MVSGKQIGAIIRGILLRVLLLVPIAIVSFFLQEPFYTFLIETLQYQEPPAFFGYNLYFFGLGWVLSWTFWSGIMYGTMSKKLDYFFIALIFCFSVWNLYISENVTPLVYGGLIGVAAVGLAIGYGLKLLRQRIF